MRKVYLDNNATTAVAPEVGEALRPMLDELYGNPSSLHDYGVQARLRIENARAQTAALLGTSPEEIVFTSGGTESNNTVLRGVVDASPSKPHILTTTVEHPAILSVCEYLEAQGNRVTRLPVDAAGCLDLDQLEQALTPDTALVSIMWANNETGVIFPIEEIAGIVKKAGKLLHVDAVQAISKLPIDLSRVPIDFLSLSGHKLHAPKGIGALYIRKGQELPPLLRGGHQERGQRAGTENAPSIVALGAACALARENLETRNQTIAALRDRLEQGILDTCPDVVIHGCDAPRLCNTSSISFDYIEGESILLLMDDAGIAASSGSACSSGQAGPSHVIRAMGVPLQRAHGSVRFSLSRYTTEDDIDYVLNVLPGIVRKLRDISPYSANRRSS